jgi:hypothetical protein
LAIATKRWDGMRWTRAASGVCFAPDEALSAYGEVVWFWRRDAGAKLAEQSVSDGDNKPAHRGERDISRKAIAQGMSECFRSPVCSCAPLFAQFAHETAGAACTRRSLLPLFLRRDNEFENNSGKPCREIADPHSLVIARLDRAPSIPEAAVIESREPGVLHTRIRGYDDRWW